MDQATIFLEKTPVLQVMIDFWIGCQDLCHNIVVPQRFLVSSWVNYQGGPQKHQWYVGAS